MLSTSKREWMDETQAFWDIFPFQLGVTCNRRTDSSRPLAYVFEETLSETRNEVLFLDRKNSRPLRFLFSTAETHPTYRADVRVLFGLRLPQFGVRTDLVAAVPASKPSAAWSGGRLFSRRYRSRAGLIAADVAQQILLLKLCRGGYDGLIVRDKPLLALIGLAAARLAGISFIYWMSFPMPEAYLMIAHTPGTPWTRRIYAWLRGQVGAAALYRIVIPSCDFLFVQSSIMLDDVRSRKAEPRLRALPVPMGVDTEAIDALERETEDETELSERQPSAVYLGTLSPLRRAELELMVDAAKRVGLLRPQFELVVIGEADTEEDKGWLQRYAEKCGALPWVRFLGWMPYEKGLSQARRCQIGLSPFPRGPLFDSASPTKAVEYMALKLPVVCNDQPDQARIIEESKGGLCVALSPFEFAAAIIKLLDDPERARAMGEKGHAWVMQNRDYRRLAASVADALRFAVTTDRTGR